MKQWKPILHTYRECYGFFQDTSTFFLIFSLPLVLLPFLKNNQATTKSEDWASNTLWEFNMSGQSWAQLHFKNYLLRRETLRPGMVLSISSQCKSKSLSSTAEWKHFENHGTVFCKSLYLCIRISFTCNNVEDFSKTTLHAKAQQYWHLN